MNSRLKTGLAKLRVKILKDAFGKTMPQAMAASILEIPLTTYIAYEKGARRISRRIAEKASATWHVSPDYLMQAPPKGDPISIAGETLTWQDAQRASMTRLFGFDTWNGQHRTTKLAELLFLNIHRAIHDLSWGLCYSAGKKRGHGPPKRFLELKRRVNAGEELNDTERSKLETLGKKWAKKKDTDFEKLRTKGHEAAERFLFDALAAIHEVLDKHNLPHEVLPGFDTRYTAILEDVLEDPQARIVYRDGKEIKEFGEFQPVSLEDKPIEFADKAAPLTPNRWYLCSRSAWTSGDGIVHYERHWRNGRGETGVEPHAAGAEPLGVVEEYPIIGPKGEVIKIPSTRDPAILEKFSRDTAYRLHAQIIDPADGRVVEVRPITLEEAIKFQPVPLKEGSGAQLDAPAPKRLPKEEIDRQVEGIGERMRKKGRTEEEIRERVERVRKRLERDGPITSPFV